MKSTRLKSVLLAAVCLATTSLMAQQDTTDKPKGDTTMRHHRHDSTSMNLQMRTINANHDQLQTVFDMNTANIIVLKNDMEDRVSAKKPSQMMVS